MFTPVAREVSPNQVISQVRPFPGTEKNSYTLYCEALILIVVVCSLNQLLAICVSYFNSLFHCVSQARSGRKCVSQREVPSIQKDYSQVLLKGIRRDLIMFLHYQFITEIHGLFIRNE